MSTIVASAIDSPSCGMMIGTCAIKLFFEERSRFRGDHLRAGPMRATKICVIWNRRVFCVDAHGRGVEEVKSFAGDTCDHFRGRAATGERFAEAQHMHRPLNC